jgi:hypothetical protein
LLVSSYLISPLGGRHAAVIPALPEEYDASLPIGAYYPRKNETPDANIPRGLSYYPQHIIAQAEAQKVSNTAQSQEPADSVVGPSGSGISASTPPDFSSTSSQPQLQIQTTTMAAVTRHKRSGDLLIQEYRRPQSLASAPPQEAQAQTLKRVTRSSAAAANTSPSTSGSVNTGALSTRQSKTASKAQPNQKRAPKPVSAVSPADTSDGTLMTLAGIMKAYPSPHLTLSTATPNSTGATGS